MSLDLNDAPAVLRGLLQHQADDCAGPWMVTREPHPTDTTIARLLLTCPGCQARHLYDVRKLATGSTGRPIVLNGQPVPAVDGPHLRLVREEAPLTRLCGSCESEIDTRGFWYCPGCQAHIRNPKVTVLHAGVERVDWAHGSSGVVDA